MVGSERGYLSQEGQRGPVQAGRSGPVAEARRSRRLARLGAALALVYPVALGIRMSATRDAPPEDAGGAVSSTSADQQDALYQVPYNGRFTFARIRYGGGASLRGWGRGGSSWAHDYPDADRNIQLILDEFTSIPTNTEGSNVLELDDPRMFQHPLIYISEPGFWTITEEGARNLRQYLLKGGFLIFDDFEANQWYNMDAQLARALPERQWVQLDESHPIFGSFFYVEDIYVPHPSVRVQPRYMAIFEDNDPRKRVMVLANHNSDLAEYWEWSTTAMFAVDPTNDAYRLGVNYIIYGLTH